MLKLQILPKLCQNLSHYAELCQFMNFCETYQFMLKFIGFAKVMPKSSNYFNFCQSYTKNFKLFQKFCQIYHVMSDYANLWKFAKVIMLWWIFSPKQAPRRPPPLKKKGKKKIHLNHFSYYRSLHSISAFVRQMIFFFNKQICSFILKSYFFHFFI